VAVAVLSLVALRGSRPLGSEVRVTVNVAASILLAIARGELREFVGFTATTTELKSLSRRRVPSHLVRSQSRA
jgi:hypothetical protein